MEQDNMHLLEMIDRPAFIVRDGIITYSNKSAQNRQVKEGTAIATLIPEDCDAYDTYSGGVLYMTLNFGWVSCGATVTRQEDTDIFLLDRDYDQTHLQILALAAQQLRMPLSNAMTVMDDMLPSLEAAQQEHGAQLSRSLYQLMRLISNMADADRYLGGEGAAMERTELRSFFREVFEKAGTSLEDTEVSIAYTGPEKQVFSMIDRERMERAVYNLLSNAVKFSPPKGQVQATLVRNGNRMRLTVEDHGSGIAPHVMGSLYHRYLREPAIEDSRFGLGLGMSLVRSVASNHGGTVLVEKTEGTRVTMTFAVRNVVPCELRSPILRMSNYAGGRELGLVEFAEKLPIDSYKKKI